MGPSKAYTATHTAANTQTLVAASAAKRFILTGVCISAGTNHTGTNTIVSVKHGSQVLFVTPVGLAPVVCAPNGHEIGRTGQMGTTAVTSEASDSSGWAGTVVTTVTGYLV